MLRRTQLLILLLSMLIVMGFGPVPAVSAQAEQPIITVDAAFEGVFKYGEWLLIRIDVENQGSDIDGELSVIVGGSPSSTIYAAPVSLPSGSHKLVPLYVLPNNFARELEVRLTSGTRLVQSKRVAVRPHANISYFVGMVTPRRGALALINAISFTGQERPKVLVDFTLEELPERPEALYSFDALIFNDTDTSALSVAQRTALESWVQQGGRLIIGGGAGAARTVSGLPENLLPTHLEGSVEVETGALAGLASFATTDPIRVPGPFVVAGGSSTEGRILAGNDVLPLISERIVGAGKVDFIALDLSGPPFDGWSGTQMFWQALLAPGAEYPMNMPPDMSVRQIRSGSVPYALSNMPVLDLPSVSILSVLLGLYILLVGPVNYLVLKRSKRLHLAWITIPVLTLTFSAAAFGTGYLLRGTDLVLNKIAIVELHPDGSAGVTSYLGLFSPGQQAYEVEVHGSGLVSPLSGYYDPWSGVSPTTGGSEMVFVQGEPSLVRGLNINQWSMQSFMAEDTWSDFGRISANLHLEGEELVGTVRNETAYPIRDVVVVLSRRYARIGDLAPGQEAEVYLPLADIETQRFGPSFSYMLFEQELNMPGPYGPNREAEMKRSIVESVFERGTWSKLAAAMPQGSGGPPSGVLLLGWLDQAPPDITVVGKEPAQQTTALVYTSLKDYGLTDTDSLDLPPGIISGRLVQSPTEGGTCGDPWSMSVYLIRGDAEFEFQLPEGIRDFQVNTLNLSLWTDMGFWNPPDVAVYDWTNDLWLGVSNPQQGANLIQDAAPLVNDNGQVRVRLTSNDQIDKGCLFLNLGLQAERLLGKGGGA